VRVHGGGQGGNAVITVPAEEMARLLTALRDEYRGSVEELLAAARGGALVTVSRRRRPEPVPPRSAGEVLEAVRLRLVTREEARRLLGLRAKPTTRATRSRAAGPLPEVVGGVMREGAA
jgi:hypothetical protein